MRSVRSRRSLAASAICCQLALQGTINAMASFVDDSVPQLIRRIREARPQTGLPADVELRSQRPIS
jgi:hypothetical protein